MTCQAPDCKEEAKGTLTNGDKTKSFCDTHYQLALMVMTILEQRAKTGENPDFDTVNTLMDRTPYIN